MIHRCVINSLVMQPHVLVRPCWCVYVALFGSSLLFVHAKVTLVKIANWGTLVCD